MDILAVLLIQNRVRLLTKGDMHMSLTKKSEMTAKVEQKSPIKVMIADDDLPTRMLLRAAINQWGYEVVEASDGEQAWKILQQKQPPMLLVVDWLMPKIDGIELSARIKQELTFHPYVILLTQLTGTSNIIKALEAGADEFLTKPFNMTELRSRLAVGAKIISYKNTMAQQTKQLEQFEVNIETMTGERTIELVQHTEFIMMLESLVRISQDLSNAVHKLLPDVYQMRRDDRNKNTSQIQKIQEMIGNLNYVVENIKTLHSDSSMHASKPQAREINEIIKRAVTICQNVLNNVDIEYSLAEDLPPVSVDGEMLQAFIGLILNDIEALKKQADGILTIKTNYIKEIHFVQVIVQCSTKNTDDAKFKPVFKFLGGTFTDPANKELKLSVGMSQDIIQKNNGTLHIESNADGSLRFTVDLPVPHI